MKCTKNIAVRFQNLHNTGYIVTYEISIIPQSGKNELYIETLTKSTTIPGFCVKAIYD